MVWDAKSAKALKAFSGTYSLPGGCWAVLTTTRSSPKDALVAAAVPEGYEYTWAVLAPGEPPNLRGHRMAGVDNSAMQAASEDHRGMGVIGVPVQQQRKGAYVTMPSHRLSASKRGRCHAPTPFLQSVRRIRNCNAKSHPNTDRNRAGSGRYTNRTGRHCRLSRHSGR